MLLSGFVAIGALAAPAHADGGDLTYLERPMDAPTGAFEIGMATGFSHAGGRLQRGVSVDDDGATFELTLGYRLSPELSITWYGAITDFGGSDYVGTEALGLATGVAATWHLAPFRAFDPWISTGGGFRAYIIDPQVGDGIAYLGLDLVHLRIGADIRISPRVSVSPMLGMDVTTYVQTVDQYDYTYDIGDRRLSLVFFAGFGGRFDVGGGDVPATSGRFVAAAR
jgi:hypothetical protein